MLLDALGPYGVTNDRLDTVSNYYRYNRANGEIWPTTPATAYATLRNGLVTGFTLTNPGSGYSSPPLVTIPGMTNLHLTPTLAFGPDFAKNGSIKAITLNP